MIIKEHLKHHTQKKHVPVLDRKTQKKHVPVLQDKSCLCLNAETVGKEKGGTRVLKKAFKQNLSVCGADSTL